MYKIGFVLLQYMNKNETIKCAQSIIKRIDTENYEVIIVDNGSPNNVGIEIKEKYKKNNKVHIILNDENLGFSGGNNIGFEYAKNKLKCDFIVMANNDTYLVQDDFFEKILKEYKESKFAVLGPKILLRDGKVFQFDGKPQTIKKLKKANIRLTIKMLKHYLFLGNIIKDNHKNRVEDNKDLNTKKYDLVLHGCCWVFSPEYIKIFDGIEQKTFLYCEEDFLYLRLKRNNLISVYDPEVLIFHEGSVTTRKKSKENIRKSNLFAYKNRIKANKVLMKELKKEEACR